MLSKNRIKEIRSLERKKMRNEKRLFVAEGPKVVGDLMRVLSPRLLLHTEEWTPEAGDYEEIVVSGEELRHVSFLQHPQEVLGVFPMFGESLGQLPLHQLSLALDGVQDPGNLGTIIRIADWFGIGRIYCSQDTADVYNPKVVQATMGSLARVQVCYTDLPKLVDNLPKGFPVYGTMLEGSNIYTQDLAAEGLVVMGNEGNGISTPLRQRITHKLLIPCCQTADTRPDSLNVAVATALTIGEFRRRADK
ncbi:MAG: RNA methyltransferase [Bacteroidales bacterium]|nr:RNA methyltransferase [Bacteroidales bacterium]